MSTIRRKPPVTYKSPSGLEWNNLPGFTILRDSRRDALPSTINPAPLASDSISTKKADDDVKAKVVVKAPSPLKTSILPLYHPLGSLALSLPPLNPASFGLPLPPLNLDESGSRRTRRPEAKLREPEETPVPIAPLPTVSSIAAVAAREIKEKPVTRKRRQAGGGKRKRKDLEDGDASYPAKRGRASRAIIHRDNAAEEDSPNEAEGNGGEDGSNGDAASDSVETSRKQPERRSTRSRAGAARRASTPSDSASNEQTNEPSALAGPADEANSGAPTSSDITNHLHSNQSTVHERNTVEADEKEEGELSDH